MQSAHCRRQGSLPTDPGARAPVLRLPQKQVAAKLNKPFDLHIHTVVAVLRCAPAKGTQRTRPRPGQSFAGSTKRSTWGAATPAQTCPESRYEELVLPDPAGQPLHALRPIRDEIERRVQTLLEQLGIERRGGGWPPNLSDTRLARPAPALSPETALTPSCRQASVRNRFVCHKH
jgi:hypothetical protein